MRWLPLMSVLIGLSIAVDRLAAEEAERTVVGGRSVAEPSILRADGVNVRLVVGRLQWDTVRYRKGSQQVARRRAADGSEVSESLSVDVRRGHPRLHYRREANSRSWTLDVDRRGRILIDVVENQPQRRTTIVQPVSGPLAIRHHEDGQTETTTATSWLHWYIAQPERYQEQIEPLLDDLLFPYRLRGLADDAHSLSLTQIMAATDRGDVTVTEAAVAGGAVPDAEGFPFDDRELDRWVKQLGAPRLADRVEAQRFLLSLGLPLLPRLDALDLQRLDVEQRARLEILKRQLTPRGEDCRRRLAALIRDDPDYWVAAAPSLSTGQRERIAARFAASTAATRIVETPPAERRLR